jgi:NADH-quinone oxidoreductase subunit N
MPGSVLAPTIAMAVTAVAVMLSVGAYRHHRLTWCVTLTGLLVSLGLAVLAWPHADRPLPPLFVVDHYALFFQGVFMLVALALVLLSYGYLQRHEAHREEFYILLLLATLGSMTLVAATHFASLFLGLEVLSVSLYGLIAYRAARARGVEAGIKYLLLSGTSSAFLLLGMALVYAELGTMQLGEVAGALGGAQVPAVQLAGLLLIGVAVGFKLALVPFHFWTPDVYEGAPAPVSGLIATVSKGGVFALALRYADGLHLADNASVALLLGAGAIASMTVGNLLALKQSNLKRLLAYSSIAHMGYLLIALLVTGPLAPVVATVYLVTYFAAILVAFGVVAVLAHEGEEPEDIAAYRGLAWRRPWLAGALTGALFSLAGLPLTAGFIGKFLLLAAGVSRELWVLVLAVAVNSTIGLFYYLRALSVLYQQEEYGQAGVPAPPAAAPLAAGLALGALTVVIVWLGVYPAPLLVVLREVIPRFRP